MISFFSKKPKLVDLIPLGFIDIHSHVLPKIDDGSKSIEETTILLEKMAEIGFEKCIVTPHTMTNIWDNSSGFIEDTFEKTKRKLPNDLSKMRVRASSEYMMDESFIERLQNQPLLTIKDEIVLVEMSYLNPALELPFPYWCKTFISSVDTTGNLFSKLTRVYCNIVEDF